MRRYAPRPTHLSMTNGPKRWCDSLDDGLLVAMSLPSSQTLSPCVKTGAGSRHRLYYIAYSSFALVSADFASSIPSAM
jgi:hypothetical protein